jgi:hypothetical protein
MFQFWKLESSIKWFLSSVSVLSNFYFFFMCLDGPDTVGSSSHKKYYYQKNGIMNNFKIQKGYLLFKFRQQYKIYGTTENMDSRISRFFLVNKIIKIDKWYECLKVLWYRFGPNFLLGSSSLVRVCNSGPAL